MLCSMVGVDVYFCCQYGTKSIEIILKAAGEPIQCMMHCKWNICNVVPSRLSILRPDKAFATAVNLCEELQLHVDPGGADCVHGARRACGVENDL